MCVHDFVFMFMCTCLCVHVYVCMFVCTCMFSGRSGIVTGVELDNGDVLQADLVILGVGVIPNTDLVRGVEKLPDQSLNVDPFMKYVE